MGRRQLGRPLPGTGTLSCPGGHRAGYGHGITPLSPQQGKQPGGAAHL